MSVVHFAPENAVRGWLHEPVRPNGDAILLTHGAGADCNSKLLVALAGALEEAGFLVLCFDLPFRQANPHGPPRFGSGENDRSGIRQAISAMKDAGKTRSRIFLGGHSYGGRQSSMLVADEPAIAHGLLLLSYPLHPPRKPDQLRTAHFPKLIRPAFFVHGTRDPFGSIGEITNAVELIPGSHAILEIAGAGHDLLRKSEKDETAQRIAFEFQSFVKLSGIKLSDR